ncbi:MAG: four helix bundle protein [bacterium]
MLKSHKELIAYQKAYELCLEIYRDTKGFPKEELYGLVSQMRRAAVSIPSNIAEGYSRKNRKEYVQFLRIALGSCAELETQVSLSIDLEYISREKGEELKSEMVSVVQLLTKLISSLDK